MSNEIPIFAMSPTEAAKIVLVQSAEIKTLRATNAELVGCLKLWREGYMFATREQLGAGVNHYMDKADELSKAAIERSGGK